MEITEWLGPIRTVTTVCHAGKPQEQITKVLKFTGPYIVDTSYCFPGAPPYTIARRRYREALRFDPRRLPADLAPRKPASVDYYRLGVELAMGGHAA